MQLLCRWVVFEAKTKFYSTSSFWTASWAGKGRMETTAGHGVSFLRHRNVTTSFPQPSINVALLHHFLAVSNWGKSSRLLNLTGQAARIRAAPMHSAAKFCQFRTLFLEPLVQNPAAKSYLCTLNASWPRYRCGNSRFPLPGSAKGVPQVSRKLFLLLFITPA